ncbi:MAG: hemerythrin family protein [Candidatus Niyogibacteria bacterium]|nr:hemerythrin family protein [Candidatus Niyogibacteria bacterium]
MPLLTWEQKNSVGVRELDDQHKKLFSIINRLYDSMHTGKDIVELNSVLKEMIDYADYHFSMEEKYFDLFNFEEKVTHIAKHRAFDKKAAEFMGRNMLGDPTLSFFVLDFLEDWWLGHINNTDKRYTKCFNDHGLNGAPQK